LETKNYEKKANLQLIATNSSGNLKAENYAVTSTLQRSIARIDPGTDRYPPGGKLWLGGIGQADPDKVLYDQPFRTIQPQIPAKDTLGPDEGGRFVQIFATEEQIEIARGHPR
jgi:hypothetical protein